MERRDEGGRESLRASECVYEKEREHITWKTQSGTAILLDVNAHIIRMYEIKKISPSVWLAQACPSNFDPH